MSTRIEEIADGLFQIHTPETSALGGFSFNQYLLVDDDALLFHTGPRALFPEVLRAIESVMPLDHLKYVGFGHIESDECGSLNQFLAVARNAVPLCGQIGAMVSVMDLADRPPEVLGDGQGLTLGHHVVRWFDAPHVPHGWENGFLMVDSLHALLCGDLLTQPGAVHPALVESDILGPSEAMRAQMDYYAHSPATGQALNRLADQNPQILACMHGSAWRGDGRALLRELSTSLMR